MDKESVTRAVCNAGGELAADVVIGLGMNYHG